MESRKIRGALKTTVLVCLLIVAGYFILNAVIREKIRRQFTAMSPFLTVEFSKVHANILSSSVSFDNLDINFIPYKNQQQAKHHLHFPVVSMNGISFLKFLFNKNLEATELLLANGSIQLDSFLLDKKDSAQSKVLSEIKWPFKKFYVANIAVENSQVFLHSEKSDQQLARANAAIKGVSINKPGERPSFSDIVLHLSEVNYQMPGYKIQFSNLTVNSSLELLELDSLRVTAPGSQNKINIPSIRMKGFAVMKLLNEKTFIAKNIDINNSKIALVKNANSKTMVLPFDLEKIYINNFQCHDLALSYKDKTGECRLIADISLSDIDADPLFDINKTKFGSIYSEISDFHYSGNNYQNIAIKTIKADSKKELVQATDINILPQVGKYELGKTLGYQADWLQAYISKVDIVKADFKKLAGQKLFADKIKIGESKAYIFRDRRLPRPQKTILLPVDIIRTLPIDIRIKTCELETSAVEYEEYPRSGYGKTGVLKIEKINLSCSPLINHPTGSDPAYMTMNVDGSIMGSGTTHGVVMMPLQKNKPYCIKGAIERLELTKLNSSSENLGKIRIKSGFLDFLSFDFTMTEQRSTGKIIGAYHHLIIQQLKKHTDEKNVADFASFALRHAIIPPNKDASLPERKRTGKVDYQRDPSRMVSYYFLQSLLMGVKKSFTLGFLLPK